MVLKRLWQLFKKTFRKKRVPIRRRSSVKAPKKRSKKRSRRKNLLAKKSYQKAGPKPVAKKKKVSSSRGSKIALKTKVAGSITHYFPRVNAAVVKCKKSIQVGQPVLIKGSKTDFRQTIGSMQINRIPIEKARAGQEIGLEVFKEVRPGDTVFLLEG
jgi:hypothetical protein